MATSQTLSETTTRHQVYLERLKTGEYNKFGRFLLRMDGTIRTRLADKDLTSFSRSRMERLLVGLDGSLERILGDYQEQLALDLLDVAAYESQFEARALDDLGFETVLPAISQVHAAAMAQPLSVRGPDGGKLLDSFIGDWSRDERGRLIGAVRRGFFEGQTTNQILQAVRGTRANGFKDGLLSVTNRNAEAIVRTSVQHVASVARFETWKSNSDIVIGYRWVSTLDGRTSTICRSLDDQVFKIGKGPKPPVHIRCRSTTMAELDGRFSFLKNGEARASQSGPTGSQTYYEWLKTQSAAFQDDVIGPIRGKLLRDGGLTADRFAKLQLGRNFSPLTLAEMREKEPLAFERAEI